MCTPPNLRLFFMALTLVKFFQILFLFIFGCIVADDLRYHQGYGAWVKGVGVGLALCAVIGSVNVAVGLKGSLDHNKFLLFVKNLLSFLETVTKIVICDI